VERTCSQTPDPFSIHCLKNPVTLNRTMQDLTQSSKQGAGGHDRQQHVTMKGTVVTGFGHFFRRMTEFPETFRKATGETLYPGTLNVDVGKPIRIQEHCRIFGTEIGEPYQDLLFEPCLINGLPGWRIRPYVLDERAGFPVGGGGHGDHILEVSSATKIPNASAGSRVEITLFREDTNVGGPERKQDI
jgi:hypothetical protein